MSWPDNNAQYAYDTNGNVIGLTLPDGTIRYSSYILSQSGLPMILPSSGSIGDNGALSAITALPLAYTSCYMYFPANAIAAGVAAGMYYVVMSLTTTGTIYNNTYTSGTPTIPASPTAFVTTGPGAYTQTTAGNVTLVSLPLEADILGVNGGINLHLWWEHTNNANNKTETAILSGASFNGSRAATTSLTYRELLVFKNKGAKNLNVIESAWNGGFGTNSSSFVNSSVNTAVAQTITIVGRLAVATDYIISAMHTAEVFISA